MKTIGHTVLLLLVIIACVLWLHSTPLFAASATTNGTASFSLSDLTLGSAPASLQSPSYFDETGVVVIDMSDGAPGTPYLLYENSQDVVETKLLVFGDDPDCNVYGQEFPCVPSADQGLPLPTSPIAAGSFVHVIGIPDEQAVRVQSYNSVGAVPNMTLVTVSQGQTINIANDLSVTANAVDSTDGCSIRTGCFANGVDRAVTTITNGVKNTENVTSELSVGTLFPFGGYDVSLVALQNANAPLFTYVIVKGK